MKKNNDSFSYSSKDEDVDDATFEVFLQEKEKGRQKYINKKKEKDRRKSYWDDDYED